MSFGQTLRAAREAKGLTTSELAARTHLLIQIVEGLESEDFRRIPAPIYGRGFVKLYCEVVGLDPKPMQAEFMSLYSHSKDAPPKTSAPTPSPEPAAAPEPPQEPSAQEPPIAAARPTTEQPEATKYPTKEPPIATEPPITGATVPDPPESPPRRDYGELFEQTYAAEETEKISAAEKFRDTMSNVSHGVFANVKKLPPNTGRIVTVAVGSIILLMLIIWGISALYKATTPQPAPESPVAADPADKAATKPATSPTKQEAGSSKTSLPTKREAAPSKTSLPTKQEAGSSKTSLPTKQEAGSSKTSLPTKRAAASGEGKPQAAKPGALKASGIEIPSLYID